MPYDQPHLPLALWDNQRDALAMCATYFASHSQRAALVQMPTGTGKTGVIAVVASQRSIDRPVLVISPSTALTTQLSADVGVNFWDRVCASDSWRPERTHLILPSRTADLVAELDPGKPGRLVVFSTIQALLQLRASNAKAYAYLKERIGTVVFDEGHREPAPIWAAAVREFGAPTVLCSATPFRNDLKLFDVDGNHVYFLSFDEAVARRLIRDVRIEEVQQGDALDFAHRIVERRNALIADGLFAADAKIIVRCGSESSVIEMHNALAETLRSCGDGLLAVHHRFNRSKATMCPAVPADIRTRTERFLVHQFMLTEGIDDPTCTMLAIYEPFKTERQLVQQIGRVIRHPDPLRSDAAPAVVITGANSEIPRMWDRYRHFDRACVVNGGRPPLRNGTEISRSLILALPEIDYAFGRFRRRMALDEPEIDAELRFPKSCVIFSIAPDLDLTVFQGEVGRALDKIDRNVLRNSGTPDGRCRFHLSLALTQSPFLEETLFQQPTLEVTIYARHRDWLFSMIAGGSGSTTCPAL
jgi:hypothetical protein